MSFRDISIWAIVFTLSAFGVLGCKKGSAGGGTTQPTPNPTASPVSTPTPTATPIPNPTPIAQSDCFRTLPAEPVAPRNENGSCPDGFRKIIVGKNLSPGDSRRTEACVAKSSCLKTTQPNARCLGGDYPNVTKECWNYGDIQEYNARNGCHDGHEGGSCDTHMPGGFFFDIDRGYLDAFGRRFDKTIYPPTAETMWNNWEWGGFCPPKFCQRDPIGVVCNNPLPAPLARFRLSIHDTLPNGKKIIDATPEVCNGAPGSGFENYCQSRGFTENCCPVRQGDDPLREACENEILGVDFITGRMGPEFSSSDKDRMRAEKHPDVDYFAVVTGGGATLKACSSREPKVCSELFIP